MPPTTWCSIAHWSVINVVSWAISYWVSASLDADLVSSAISIWSSDWEGKKTLDQVCVLVFCQCAIAIFYDDLANFLILLYLLLLLWPFVVICLYNHSVLNCRLFYFFSLLLFFYVCRYTCLDIYIKTIAKLTEGGSLHAQLITNLLTKYGIVISALKDMMAHWPRLIRELKLLVIFQNLLGLLNIDEL